jgi:hypothetical protein
MDGLGQNFVWVLCHWGAPDNRTFEYPMTGDKMADKEFVIWTVSRSVKRCALVAKVGNTEVRICLFTMVTMIILVRLGLFI